ncbi:MAG: carbohydrate porin [Gemmatimonadetes bacterium]|nr:carbohydrate porin [Gemmatimonadota bacterium]
MPHLPFTAQALAMAAAIFCGAGTAAAEAETPRSVLGRLWHQEALTGDWGGARTALEQRGLSFELDYTIDHFANTRGGVRRRGETLGNVDMMLTAELEPLLGWKNARVFLYGLGNHGGNPSANVGDVQGVDNIETIDTWKLYEAWFEQRFGDDRLSLLVGLYDLNAEFDVIPAAGLFLNSSFGIGPDFAQSGLNGPSIFPTTSLGARVEFRPFESVYTRAVVLDGVPGDPDSPRGTHIVLAEEDGLLLAAEIGFEHDPPLDTGGYPGKYALGVWGYTTDLDDLVQTDPDGGPLQRDGTRGFYALAEQSVYREAPDPAQGLTLFARAGVADADVNPLESYVGGGGVYRGLIPGRHEDELGVAVAATRFGDAYREAARLADAATDRWEVALEFSYLCQLSQWLSVQPDVQIIVNPGGDPSLDDATVLGIRFVIGL